jgi:phage terminase large subunit-like protein
MPNPENLKSYKPGESGNLAGKPKGLKHKSTIARRIFEMRGVLPDAQMDTLKKMCPEITDEMTVGEIMFIIQTHKAITKQDTAAFKAITDSLPEETDERTDIEVKEQILNIRDGIIDRFYRFLQKENDWTILEGGSRSGKTHNFLMWAFIQTLTQRFDLSIIAPSFKMLELGSFVDVKNILSRFAPDIKIPERATKIDLYNGSRWTFEVVTNENEAKRNRVNVFVNEADGVPEEVANLLGRASGRKFVDFNPVKKFWAHKRINDDESNIMRSTWHDNPFLTKNQLQWFDDLKRRGENAEEGSPERYAYEVYYLGNYSLLSGKAYEMEDFDIVDQVPEKFDYMISYADPSLGTGNDFFAALLFGIKGTQVYAVDCIFSQFVKSGGYTEKLKEWDRQYKTAIDHYAEANGVGGVVTGAVQEFYHGVLNEVSNSTKKEADIIVYAPTAKRFKFVRSAKMIEFLTQCAEFPNAEHDDAPDCLSRGAKLILKHFDI